MKQSRRDKSAVGEPDVGGERGDRCKRNASEPICSRRGCVSSGDSSTTVTQRLICIILCVVRGMTESAGSYLQEWDIRVTLWVSVVAASSRHLAGQMASPSPVISVSMSLHVNRSAAAGIDIHI